MQDRRFGKPLRCTCRASEDAAKRASFLEQIDGLTTEERTYTFNGFIVAPGNQAAYTAVVGAAGRGCGMVTLHGLPGRGKTYLLISAVNDARSRKVPAVYTTMTTLLDHLKRAFDPKKDSEGFDRRWELLVNADVLAIDEIDEFNTTEWAMERFLRLVDERWRRMGKVLTLFATNTELRNLPEKVESRVRDIRGAVVEVSSPVDFRGI